MSVNSVNNVNSSAAAYTAPVQQNTTKAAENTESSKNTAADKGVVYEKNNDTKTPAKNSIYSRDEIIARMKRDTETRTAQLRSLVEKMMTRLMICGNSLPAVNIP